MEDLKNCRVIVIHETLLQSWGRDLGTATMIIGLWTFGYFIESAAMEWIGVMMALMFMAARVFGRLADAYDSRMTPAEARQWLDKNFPTGPAS